MAAFVKVGCTYTPSRLGLLWCISTESPTNTLLLEEEIEDDLDEDLDVAELDLLARVELELTLDAPLPLDAELLLKDPERALDTEPCALDSELPPRCDPELLPVDPRLEPGLVAPPSVVWEREDPQAAVPAERRRVMRKSLFCKVMVLPASEEGPEEVG